MLLQFPQIKDVFPVTSFTSHASSHPSLRHSHGSRTMAQAASSSSPVRSPRFRQSAYHFGTSKSPRCSQSQSSHPSCPSSVSQSRLAQGDSTSTSTITVPTTKRPGSAYGARKSSTSSSTYEGSSRFRTNSASTHTKMRPALVTRSLVRDQRDPSKSSGCRTVILYARSPRMSSAGTAETSFKSVDFPRGPPSVQRSAPSAETASSWSAGTPRCSTRSGGNASLPRLPRSPVRCLSSRSNSPADAPLSSSGRTSPYWYPRSSVGKSPVPGSFSPYRTPRSEFTVTSAPVSSPSMSTFVSSRCAEHSKSDTKLVASSTSHSQSQQTATNPKERTMAQHSFLPSSPGQTKAKSRTKRKSDSGSSTSKTQPARRSTNAEDGPVVRSKVEEKNLSNSEASASSSLYIPVPKRSLASDPQDYDSDSEADSLNLRVFASCDDASSTVLDETASISSTSSTPVSSAGILKSLVPSSDTAATASGTDSSPPTTQKSCFPTSSGRDDSNSAVSRNGGFAPQSPLVVPSPRRPASENSDASSFFGEDDSIPFVSESSDASISPPLLSLSLMSHLPDCNSSWSSDERLSVPSTTSPTSSATFPGPAQDLRTKDEADEKQDLRGKLLKTRMEAIQEIIKRVTMKTLLTLDEIKELKQAAQEALMRDDVRTVIKNKMSINLLNSMIKEAKHQQKKVIKMYKSLKAEILKQV